MTDDTPQDPNKPRKATRKPPAKKAPAKKVARKSVPAKKAKATPPARKVAKKATPPAKKAPARKVASGVKLTKTEVEEKAAASVTALIGEAHRSVGRPTKYRDEYVAQMIAFFNIEVQTIKEITVLDAQGMPKQDKEGNVITAKVPVVNTFPTLERFAANLGVTKLTLYNWAHDTDDEGQPLRPEFLYAYARAKDMQAALTIEGSYAGAYESRAAALGLKNLAGWKDQLEAHVEGTITSATVEDLDALYAKGIENSRRAAEEAKNRVLYGVVPGTAAVITPGGMVHRADDDEDDERDE